MMRGVATFLALTSVVLFPWPLTVILAVVSAFVEPLLPLAVGIFVDTLYYTPQAHTLPIFTLSGALVTIVAFVVRSRLRASIME